MGIFKTAKNLPGRSPHIMAAVFEEGNVKLKIPVECYSRVVGYFRPVNQWNPGKREEFRDRKTYDVNRTEVKKQAEESEIK